MSSERPARTCESYDSNRAVTLISALNSFETGQPVSAAFTAVLQLALSAPGVCATRSRWLFVIAEASGGFLSRILALVFELPAVGPSLAHFAETSLGQHPARGS